MQIKHLILSLFVAVGMMISPVWAGDMVNLNTATAEQLQTVKGIGEKTAEAIIQYREKHGAFASVDDLLNVKGIGDKTLARISPSLEVGDTEMMEAAAH